MAKRLQFVGSGLAAVLLGACVHLPQSDGELSVGRPQVFTRERLLSERLGEVAWLREQLDRPVEPGLQGLRDLREASDPCSGG